MKPENWISATGLSPAAAMPTATPPIASSASGVSITRSRPKRSSSPCVARNTPPLTPTSSPRITTRSSSAMARASASVTAPTRVVSGMAVSPAGRGGSALLGQRARQLRVEIVEHRLGRLRLCLEIAFDRRIDLAVDLLDQALLVRLGPHAGLDQVGAQARDRVGRPALADRFGAAIAAGVVRRGVVGHPISERLDHARPFARPGAR